MNVRRLELVDAGALATGGTPVLAVDADSQGALAAALGVRPEKPTLYEVLAGQAVAVDAIESTALDGLDVLPADLDLAGAEVELTRRPDWQTTLRRILDPVRGSYDLLLVDTPPGLGVLPYAALVAADAAWSPPTPPGRLPGRLPCLPCPPNPSRCGRAGPDPGPRHAAARDRAHVHRYQDPS
jgi:AAA domain